MNQARINQIMFVAENLLVDGDRETLRQAVAEITNLLLAGPTPEQGGPVAVDPTVLASAITIANHEFLKDTIPGFMIAQQLSSIYRERYIGRIQEVVGSVLTPAELLKVEESFDSVVLSGWLLSTGTLLIDAVVGPVLEEPVLIAWKEDLAFAEVGGGIQKVLTFGVDSTASDGLDSALGEVELPPLPPVGVYDARFTTLQTLVDIRPSTNPQVEQILPLSFQRTRDDVLTIISWNDDSLAEHVVSASLQDQFGGMIVNVNMLEIDFYQVDTVALKSLNVVFTSK